MARPDVLRQVRRFCLDCQGNSTAEILQCRDETCHLWPWRLGKNTPETEACGGNTQAFLMLDAPEKMFFLQKMALRVVRKHCLSCAGDRKDVRQCTARDACPLWSLRFGVYPTTYKRVKARLAQGKRLRLF